MFILLSVTSSAIGQTRQKGWFDVNLGAARSRAGSVSFAFSDTVFDERLSLNSTYPDPSTGAAFDFGGGLMLSRTVGLGLSISGTGHRDPGTVGVLVPHPFFFNASASATGITQKLTRAEGAVHVQVVAVPHSKNALQVRLFGGPSYFRYRADMVQDIAFAQAASASSRSNVVTITGSNIVEAEGTGWGFHVGGDVNYFFTRVVGVGGFARFSAGDVTIDPEPLSEVEQKVRVGGLQTGGGLRLRF